MSEQEKKETINRSAHDKQNPYAQISKEMLHDKSISPKSKGMLCFMLSLPSDWVAHPRQIAEAMGVGKEQIYGILEELITEGYATRETVKGEKGQFDWVRYEFYEFKIKSTVPDIQTGHLSGNPDTGFRALLKNNLKEKDTTTTSPVVVVPDSDLHEKKRQLESYDYDQDTLSHLLTFPLSTISQAIMAYEEKSRIETIDSKLGFIRRAIEKGCRPEQQETPEKVKNREINQDNASFEANLIMIEDNKATSDRIISYCLTHEDCREVKARTKIYPCSMFDYFSIGSNKIPFTLIRSEFLSKCVDSLIKIGYPVSEKMKDLLKKYKEEGK